MVLFLGVSIVQLADSGATRVLEIEYSALCALLFATSISGLCGALLEKAFKSTLDSIWVKNFFLSLYSLPFAAYSCVQRLHPDFEHNGPFHGVDNVVILTIILLALGGLLTASVMKYAGTIAKCFAVSLSIFICAVFGSSVGHQQLNSNLIVGGILVNASVLLFFLS